MALGGISQGIGESNLNFGVSFPLSFYFMVVYIVLWYSMWAFSLTLPQAASVSMPLQLYNTYQAQREPYQCLCMGVYVRTHFTIEYHELYGKTR